MIEASQVNSTFYALRLLSHGLDTSQIEVTGGEEYPASEFTREEQEEALRIIHSIEASGSVSFDQLPPDKIDFYLETLANRIEELANMDLANAGYAVEITTLGPDESRESDKTPNAPRAVGSFGEARTQEGAIADHDIDDISASQSALSSDLQGEIDLLRGEPQHRKHLAQSLKRFLERISSRDLDKTYSKILTHARELLQAERVSLWVFDEDSNEIILRAAAGFTAAQGEVGRLRIGEGISGRVLESGQPLIVENLGIARLTPEPAERRHKTKSFISYPLTKGDRKIGVLNVSDKSGGRTFDEVDLSLLEIIGPQIAIALERAERQERAALPNDPNYHGASRS